MSLRGTDARVRRGASFARQVSKFVRAAEGKADQAVRRIALGVLANVVEASPVDTGRFRGNWQVGVGQRPTGDVAGEEKDSGSVVSREGAKLEPVRVGDTCFITNNLPYARRLEFGHSAQAPRGMVRLTLASLGDILGEAAE